MTMPNLPQLPRAAVRSLMAGALVGVLVALGYLLGGCATAPPVNRATICHAVQGACAVASSYCAAAP